MAEVAAETGVKRSLEEAEVADVEAKKLRAEEAGTVEAPSTAEANGAAADAATEDPTPSTSEPIVVGYKSFESGTALYEYYKMLHSKLRKYQDLNEVRGLEWECAAAAAGACLAAAAGVARA